MMDCKRLFVVLTALALSMGCASLDAAPVEDARAAVQSARSHANVDSDSLDLEEAGRHLALAEDALGDGFQAAVEHHAYMATNYARVAQAQAEARLAQDEASGYLDRTLRNTARTQSAVELAVRRARALDAQQTERDLVLTLGGVLFAFNSAELKPEAAVSVARVAGFLIAMDDREVLIEGHTDNVGSDEYNLELSEHRAQSARAALIESGIAASRIVAKGFGSSMPVASNDEDAGREKNRRVEIIILDSGRRAAQSRRGS